MLELKITVREGASAKRQWLSTMGDILLGPVAELTSRWDKTSRGSSTEKKQSLARVEPYMTELGVSTTEGD